MKFFIENAPVFTSLRVEFLPGETFIAEAGAMMSMSPTIELASKTTGKGVFGALKATLGGESLFAVKYEAKDAGEVILAPPIMGDIIQVEMDAQTIFTQSGAYLAGTTGLEISSQGSWKGLVSGEGLFLSKITGSGTLFLNSYGSVILKNLAAGEKYIVDNGHMVAFDASVNYSFKKAAKSWLGSVATGEGYVCEFSGPGRLWLQTRNLSPFAEMIMKYSK